MVATLESRTTLWSRPTESIRSETFGDGEPCLELKPYYMMCCGQCHIISHMLVPSIQSLIHLFTCVYRTFGGWMSFPIAIYFLARTLIRPGLSDYECTQ